MYDTSTNFLNVHEWAYGLTEVAHILSLAVSIGLIALVDLRLLGVGPRHVTPARLLRGAAARTQRPRRPRRRVPEPCQVRSIPNAVGPSGTLAR